MATNGVARIVLPGIDWLLGQPEVTRSFDDWAGRVRDLEARLEVRLGAVALAHGFASGEALHDADPATLSPLATDDRTDVLREHRAATLADGRQLGRELIRLAETLLPRAGAAPGAVGPMAQHLADMFFARL